MYETSEVGSAMVSADARMGSVDVVDASVKGSAVVCWVRAIRTTDAKACDLEASASVSKAWEWHLVSQGGPRSQQRVALMYRLAGARRDNKQQLVTEGVASCAVVATTTTW